MKLIHSIKLVTCLLALGLISTSVFSKAMDFCTDVQVSWGKNCNSSSSVQLKVTNNCGQTIYFNANIEKEDGIKVGHFVSAKFGAGHTEIVNECHSTGMYNWRSCTLGKEECGLPYKSILK